MPDRLDLPRRYREQIEALLREHVPGVEVWAYGSRVNGQSHEASDLDLMLRGPDLKRISSGQLTDLTEALEQSNVPIIVQIHDWARLPESFHKEIERGYVVLVEKEEQSARSGWRTMTIEDIAEKVAMGPFGSSIKVETFVPEGVPIISGQHLHGSRVDDGPGFNFISNEHAQRLANANVMRGDIVLTHRGTIGQVACIPENSQFDRYIVSQSQFYIRCNRSKAIPEFVTMYFRSHEGQHQLLANTSQVGVPSIAQPVTYLRTIEIPIPPLSEQRAIAHILGTLDDKIELNRRMNETLEEMARALFKSWFVDFDPVRAKMEGRDPGLPKHLADLFPNRLVASELGLIPEGWEVGCFGDIVDQIRDNENPLASPDTVFHHFSIPAFDKNQWPQIERGEDIKSQKSRVPPGVILLSKLNPEVERVWFVDVASDERAICSTEFLVLQARQPFQRSYVYCLARAPFFRQQIESLVTGTSKSHQRAPAGAVLDLEAIIPSIPVIRAFDQQASVLLDRTVGYRRETITLAAQRDALLPKLVSGELRVTDVERYISKEYT